MSKPTEGIYVEELTAYIILDENGEPIRRASLGLAGAGWLFEWDEVRYAFSLD
jgi:hypothetical protein